MVSGYLKLSNHSGVLVAIFILAAQQFEGVAEISQPLEFWDILQLAVINLKTCTLRLKSSIETKEELLYNLKYKTQDELLQLYVYV